MTETSVRRDDFPAEHLTAVRDSGEEVPFRVITERPRPGVIVVSVFGALDMVSVPRFAKLLQERLASTARVVVLDLTAVSFLGVEGIKVLAQADLRAHITGKLLSLVTGVRAVDRPLEAVGMAERFTYGSRPVFASVQPVDERFVPTRRTPEARELGSSHEEASLSRA